MQKFLTLFLLTLLWTFPVQAQNSNSSEAASVDVTQSEAAVKYHPGDVEVVNNILRLIQDKYSPLTSSHWKIGQPETWGAPRPEATIDERLLSYKDAPFFRDARSPFDCGIVWQNGRVAAIKLNDAGLSGVVDLTGLTELEVLELNYNQITSLKGLSDLPKLIELDLTHNRIADIGDLSSLKELRWLDLSDNHLTSLNGLNQLKNLRWLNLSYNQLTSLENLADLTSLEGVHLGHNQLTYLADLDRLKNLRFLYLYSNQFTALEGFGGLTNLRQLNLSQNQLASVEYLGQLKKLLQLDLGGNRLTCVPGLGQLTDLNFLFLDDNHVTDLGDLSPLTQLEVMRIANNRLTRLEGLEKLTCLRVLILNGNRLPPTDFLDKFNTDQLTHFIFSGYQLPVFSRASKFKNLEELGIADGDEIQSVDLAGLTLDTMHIYDHIAPEKIRDSGGLTRLIIMRDSHYCLAELRALTKQLKISEQLMLLRSQTVILGDTSAGLKAGQAYAPAEVSPLLAAEYASGADQATILVFTQKDRRDFKQPHEAKNPSPEQVSAFKGGQLTFPAPGDYYLSISFAPYGAHQFSPRGIIHYEDPLIIQ